MGQGRSVHFPKWKHRVMSGAGGLALVILPEDSKGYLTYVLPMGQEKINLVLSVYPSDSNCTEDCNNEYTEPGHRASH